MMGLRVNRERKSSLLRELERMKICERRLWEYHEGVAAERWVASVLHDGTRVSTSFVAG
jgi:hypothetical protein